MSAGKSEKTTRWRLKGTKVAFQRLVFLFPASSLTLLASLSKAESEKLVASDERDSQKAKETRLKCVFLVFLVVTLILTSPS